jgi:hypothetical protein
MALPSSGPLSLAQIQAEFGGTVPPDLLNYYRGGPNVPDIPQNLSIPTSGSIDILNFYGTMNIIVDPEFNRSLYEAINQLIPDVLVITINGNGLIDFSENVSFPEPGWWNNAAGVAMPGAGAFCELQYTTPQLFGGGGTLTAPGSPNTWITIGSGQAFSFSGNLGDQGQTTVTIREIANPSNTTTATLFFRLGPQN